MPEMDESAGEAVGIRGCTADAAAEDGGTGFADECFGEAGEGTPGEAGHGPGGRAAYVGDNHGEKSGGMFEVGKKIANDGKGAFNGVFEDGFDGAAVGFGKGAGNSGRAMNDPGGIDSAVKTEGFPDNGLGGKPGSPVPGEEGEVGAAWCVGFDFRVGNRSDNTAVPGEEFFDEFPSGEGFAAGNEGHMIHWGQSTFGRGEGQRGRDTRGGGDDGIDRRGMRMSARGLEDTKLQEIDEEAEEPHGRRWKSSGKSPLPPLPRQLYPPESLKYQHPLARKYDFDL